MVKKCDSIFLNRNSGLFRKKMGDLKTRKNDVSQFMCSPRLSSHVVKFKITIIYIVVVREVDIFHKYTLFIILKTN